MEQLSFVFGSDPAVRMILIAAGLLMALAVGTLALVLGYHWYQNRRANRRETLRKRWEPLLLDILAGDRPSAVLRDQVREDQRSLYLDLLIEYVLVTNGQVIERLEQCGDDFLDPEVDRLSDSDPTIRAGAIQRLGLLGAKSRVHLVEQALTDPQSQVVLTAAWTLIRRDRSESYPAILRQIDRLAGYGTDQLVSMCIAMGSPVLPHLREWFEDTRRPAFTRTVAAEALRWMGDGRSAEVAAELLEKETDRELRAAALRLLRRTGRDRHAQAVRPLTEHEDEVLRLHAFGALGRLGDVSDGPMLRKGLEDSSPWVARRAAIALSELGHTKVLDQIAASDHPRAKLARQMLPAS